jgi:hypothetical protein
MRISLRASISAALAVAVLAVAAATSLANGGSEHTPISLPPEPGSVVHDVDGGLGMCVAPDDVPTGPDAPVCDDLVVHPAPDTAVPQIVEPRPGMAGVRARPFDSATVDADGVTVAIDFVSGVEPCYVLDRVEVVESEETVTITLYEGHDPSAGDVACIEIAVFKRTVVMLDAPIGDREIVDGAA